MAETIGSLTDKISIVSLKIYHMEGQTLRSDASTEHRQACERKLGVLREQITDLADELDKLADDVASGRRTMKVYRQFKMYNDPIYRPKAT